MRLTGYLAILMLVLGLSACGGGDSFSGNDSDNTDPDPTDPSPDPDPTPEPTPTVNVRIGNGSGAGFSNGILAVGLSPISARGTTSVRASLVDDSGALYTTPVTVNFTSYCAAQGTAEIDTPRTTAGGIATTTYTATGCVGDDVVTATATTDSGEIAASAVVSVQAPDIGSIEFVSATPNRIVLSGTGGANRSETARLTFRIVDEYGDPLPNRDVSFVISPASAVLVQSNGVSDGQGLVDTVVRAGTTRTTVVVTATDDLSGIRTQSEGLVISTGIADQNSFEIAADIANPRAWNWSGETVQITARVADRHNHWVPDGTTVLFQTEGGSIDSSCQTVDGVCSVTWVGQVPRPCGQQLGAPIVNLSDTSGTNNCLDSGAGVNPSEPQADSAPLGQPYGGRVTVSAVVIGEESYTDVNGNGVYDAGELFDDLGEPFIDTNEDGSKHLNHDPFWDYNNNGTYDAAGDGDFTGITCGGASCSVDTLYVSDHLTLVMAGDDSDPWVAPADRSFNLPNGGSRTIGFRLSDVNHQPLPYGTKIEVETTLGTIRGGSHEILSTNVNSALEFSFVLEGAGGNEQDTGSVDIIVEVPGTSKYPHSIINFTELAP